VIVDSHCHTSLSWFEPVETLLFQMDRNGVDQAVLTQLFGQYDPSYQRDCARRFPGRFASVVAVDTTQEDASAKLTRAVEEGASGVRLNPAVRSPGEDPLAIWREAARLGIAVSCVGGSAQFAAPEFEALVTVLPDLTFVIEHLGGAGNASATDDERARVLALASHANVYMKFGGVGEVGTWRQEKDRYAPRPGETVPFPYETPLPPYMEQAYAAFGPERLMWGSDFPPVAFREGYANALNWARDYFQSKPIAAQDLIFGEVTAKVFPVKF
jgi:L-fuconolactonase